MDIAWFRDLVICISGLVVTLVVIFIAVLAYLLYNKARSVMDLVSRFFKKEEQEGGRDG
jgi:hypothetical protein